jgi:imidazolonepropionase-like amidohydrolase
MKNLIVFVYMLLQALIASAQQDSSLIIFQHANVIDGTSNNPMLDVTVTIGNGKIKSIQRGTKKIPSHAVVIDLKGKWLMPGYIDAHVHLADVEAAKTALFLGNTTVRTMHCDHFLDIQIRDAHRNGQRDLPDIIAAAYQIRPDMFDAFPSFIADFPELSDLKPRIAGPENVRRVVRALVSKGVDHIKFLATERSGTPESDPKKRTFSDEEILALVDEAKKAGLFTAAHAHGDEGAYAAVKAGVRSIEHGTFMTDSTRELMKQKGTYLVVTYTGGAQPPAKPEYKDNPIFIERRQTNLHQKDIQIRSALKLGIKLAAGTDLRYTTHDLSMADEALYMQKAGLAPMKILQIMTSGSAKCLGIDKRTGTIKEGMEADIVILSQNPLTSLEALKDIRMIVNDGKVVFSKLD